LCCLNFFCAFAQESISGLVLDAENNLPLAFANVTINKSNIGVISDIDGNFNLSHGKAIKTIQVSYLGYEDVLIQSPFQSPLIVKLTPSLEALDEVVITNGENPANAIIKRVIAAKAKNNPMKKGGFTYTSYSKSIVDSKEFQKESDSVRKSYLSRLEKGELTMDALDNFDDNFALKLNTTIQF